jgi:hypothetical protein
MMAMHWLLRIWTKALVYEGGDLSSIAKKDTLPVLDMLNPTTPLSLLRFAGGVFTPHTNYIGRGIAIEFSRFTWLSSAHVLIMKLSGAAGSNE